MKIYFFRMFLVMMIIGLSFSGCNSHQNHPYGNPLHTDILSSKIITLSSHSFKRDSFNIYCNHELLPSNFNKWLSSPWVDYETSTKGISFLYYNTKSDDKEDGISTSTYVMNYTVNGTDTTFHIEKRTVSATK